MNFKAWDNKASLRATISAFVGFKGLWEIMDPHDKRTEGSLISLTSSTSGT